MPYIKIIRRQALRQNWPLPAKTAGELNYLLTQDILKYWKGSFGNYQAINDVIGALEGAKQEFYRRVVVPYEDKKIIENGDVY